MLDLDYRRDAIVVRIRTATPAVLDSVLLGWPPDWWSCTVPPGI
jgi:hypothetical protein